jgi:hypothetical protein
MKKNKRKKAKEATMDVIKAVRRGNREAEMDLFGPGFRSRRSVHKSKKTYTRKPKHRGNNEWG